MNLVLKKATKYDDLIALMLSLIFARLLGRDILGLTIDLDNIFFSSLLVLLFIVVFYFMTRVIISFLINFAIKFVKH
ncbi:hypothetical protein LQ50_24055 [Halalkalibacter okhensis]|uniref:Uncharacterized protein n=1 Tax=Halalkalibacter okhensis TaxID=333138 RepID=A0A0B0IE84_9BACI|nr:hypothetical protein LQ50_24055 [Halalkalibacter okhensis]